MVMCSAGDLFDNVCACRSGVILTTVKTHSSLKILILKVKKKVQLFQNKDKLPIRRRLLFKLSVYDLGYLIY